MRRVVGPILLLGGLSLAAASRQADPQAIPTFKGGVELIALDVSVLDDKRQPVHGLRAEDFTILEDGKPQALASFSAVELPDVVTERTVSAPWVHAVVPDVQKNTDVKDRRIVVIVMDDATPMPASEVSWAKVMARQVVDALGPNDLACVVYTLHRRSGQEFTGDRTRLLAAVERFSGGIEGGGVDEKGTWWDSMPFDKFNLATLTLYQGTLRLIQGLAEDLAALTGRRKALVFVSVGIPIEGPMVDVSTGGSGNVGFGEACGTCGDLFRRPWMRRGGRTSRSTVSTRAACERPEASLNPEGQKRPPRRPRPAASGRRIQPASIPVVRTRSS